MELRIVFNISRQDSIYFATMDSPDQGVKGIHVDKISFVNNSVLRLEVFASEIEYSGVFTDDRFIGTFKQRGESFPVNLSRRAIKGPARPQEPKPPFGYYSEEVRFRNEKAGITLAGTLTLPSKEGVFPVVVLISGSGPQDRNEEIMGHKPFLVIADHLAKNGIGVLRYDDRGVGESQGVFSSATTLDFADDANAAIDFLKGRKDVRCDNIGLIGHSEGGIIAPLVASDRGDIAFIVLLAAPGVKGSEIILEQQGLIARASGVSEADLSEYTKLNQEIFKKIDKYEKDPDLKNIIISLIISASKGEASYQMAKQQAEQITSPWMLFFLKYDPAIALREVKCPILAICGSKDLQVPAKMNLNAIENCFVKADQIDNNNVAKINNDVVVIEIEGLNHLFQNAETGLPSEYSIITETFSTKALSIISDWILKKIK